MSVQEELFPVCGLDYFCSDPLLVAASLSHSQSQDGHMTLVLYAITGEVWGGEGPSHRVGRFLHDSGPLDPIPILASARRVQSTGQASPSDTVPLPLWWILEGENGDAPTGTPAANSSSCRDITCPIQAKYTGFR